MTRLRCYGFIDQPMRVWIAKTARKNYWRVAHWYELSDLIQDGFLIFAICKDRYGPAIKNQAHMMALVRTSYTRHLHMLARKRGYGDEAPFSWLLEPETRPDWIDSVLGGEEQHGETLSLISEARGVVRSVLDLFTTEEGMAFIADQPPQGTRESLNRYVCRLLGLDHRCHNIPALVRSFISGEGIAFLHVPASA